MAQYRIQWRVSVNIWSSSYDILTKLFADLWNPDFQCHKVFPWITVLNQVIPVSHNDVYFMIYSNIDFWEIQEIELKEFKMILRYLYFSKILLKHGDMTFNGRSEIWLSPSVQIIEHQKALGILSPPCLILSFTAVLLCVHRSASLISMHGTATLIFAHGPLWWFGESSISVLSINSSFHYPA